MSLTRKGNNELKKVGKSIEITNKLIKEIDNRGVTLFNDSRKNTSLIIFNLKSYNERNRFETILSLFIIKNIWYFIYNLKENNFRQAKFGNSLFKELIQDIERGDLNYEYPHQYYRTRGGGFYTAKQKEEREFYISPALTKQRVDYLLSIIPASSIAKVLSRFEGSSFFYVVGIDINFK